MESMVPVCDKGYHIYNRFRHFGEEIKKLWNYPLLFHLSFLGQYQRMRLNMYLFKDKKKLEISILSVLIAILYFSTNLLLCLGIRFVNVLIIR